MIFFIRIFTVLGVELELKFYDYKSNFYDYSQLRKDAPYLYYTNDFALSFNIGENVNESCDVEGNAVAIAIDPSGKCSVFGYKEKNFVRTFEREIGKGLLLSYFGETCEINPKFHKKINFYVICDQKLSDFKMLEYDKCEINMKIYAPAGCKKLVRRERNLVKVLIGAMVIAMLAVAACKTEYNDEEIEGSRPVVREMKTIIRKGKRLIFKSSNESYSQV